MWEEFIQERRYLAIHGETGCLEGDYWIRLTRARLRKGLCSEIRIQIMSHLALYRTHRYRRFPSVTWCIDVNWLSMWGAPPIYDEGWREYSNYIVHRNEASHHDEASYHDETSYHDEVSHHATKYKDQILPCVVWDDCGFVQERIYFTPEERVNYICI